MVGENSSANRLETFVTEVEVDDLFNLYSYRLAFEEGAPLGLSRLLILYGDNGSGKTTLLSLIYHLLSPRRQRGHRTILASTPFRRFATRLGNDLIIEATKVDGLLGSFRASIRVNSRVIFDEVIRVRTDTDQISVSAENQEANDLAKALQTLGIALYYMPDDRKTQTTLDLDESEDQRFVLLSESERSLLRLRELTAGVSNENEKSPELAILKLEKWLRSQALKGSTEGEANTNSIYASIVRQIARARGSRKRTDSQRSAEALVASLRELEQRSKAYSEYALISPLQVGSLIAAVESSAPATRRIIADVLNPYVTGVQARLDALGKVQALIKLFVESVNSFFHNKSISFSLSDGLVITAKNGERLQPQMLSSGERQILLLLCNAITSREQPSIFIIDEPELSLNIKWQRRLLQALLDCTKDSPVQFVIATHSIEIITRHKPHVLKLIA